MKSYKPLLGLSLFLTTMAAIALPASAAPLKGKTAVLVHGAFADGSSWDKVIPYLEKAGLKVVAVQNSLDSFGGRRRRHQARDPKCRRTDRALSD